MKKKKKPGKGETRKAVEDEKTRLRQEWKQKLKRPAEDDIAKKKWVTIDEQLD